MYNIHDNVHSVYSKYTYIREAARIFYFYANGPATKTTKPPTILYSFFS